MAFFDWVSPPGSNASSEATIDPEMGKALRGIPATALASSVIAANGISPTTVSTTTTRRSLDGLTRGTTAAAATAARRVSADEGELEGGGGGQRHLAGASRSQRKTSEKRKEQNRNAQRAFRARKEQRLQELEDQVSAITLREEKTAAENVNLRTLVQALQVENRRLCASAGSSLTVEPASLGASGSARPSSSNSTARTSDSTTSSTDVTSPGGASGSNSRSGTGSGSSKTGSGPDFSTLVRSIGAERRGSTSRSDSMTSAASEQRGLTVDASRLISCASSSSSSSSATRDQDPSAPPATTAYPFAWGGLAMASPPTLSPPLAPLDPSAPPRLSLASVSSSSSLGFLPGVAGPSSLLGPTTLSLSDPTGTGGQSLDQSFLKDDPASLAGGGLGWLGYLTDPDPDAAMSDLSFLNNWDPSSMSLVEDDVQSPFAGPRSGAEPTPGPSSALAGASGPGGPPVGFPDSPPPPPGGPGGLPFL